MSFATIGTVITAASAAYGIYNAATAGSRMPQYPNTALGAQAVANLQAGLLPSQRRMAALEAQGGSTLKPGMRETTVGAQKKAQLQAQLDQINAQLKGAQAKAQQAAQAQAAGRHGTATQADIDAQLARISGPLTQQRDAITRQIAAVPAGGGKVYMNSAGQIVSERQAKYNFQGFGTADIEGQLARQQADIQTELGAKYGEDFARQARHEAELADPQGFAARARELELIQQGIDSPMPINPMAKTLDERMLARVGGGLDADSTELLNRAVQQANASRGGSTDAGAVGNEVTTGMEGAARRQAANQQVQAWLQSGATPEDVEYKREQQNLANLGAFVGGQTPQSQFASLSGAGQGAAPFYPGSAPPQLPGNAGQAGSQGALANWQSNLRYQSGQANGWMAGLGALLNSTGSLAQMQGPR